MSVYGAQASMTESGDPLVMLIREKFSLAQQSRNDVEVERWQPGEDAYQGRLYQTLPTSSQQVDIRFNLTRRKVQGAVAKITSMLFEGGEIPFKMRTSRHLRFIPPDMLPGAHLMTQMSEEERMQYLQAAQGYAQQAGVDIVAELENRRAALENRIRDICEQTDFQGELHNAIHEMCLHGTAIMKSPVLEYRSHPVYSGKFVGPMDYQLEQLLESEVVPTTQYVSCFNIFPAPEATRFEDAEYVIERKFLSTVQVRRLLEETQGAYDVEAVLDVLERDVTVIGGDQSSPPDPVKGKATFDNRKMEMLEFYGYLDKADLEERMDTEWLGDAEVFPVKIVMLGDRVIELVPHPYDGVCPYSAAYWQRNPQSIWGDGIYWALSDLQDHANFALSMYVMGKHLAAMPMMVADEAAFAPGENFQDLGPGRVFRARPGQADTAMRNLIVPDVSQGLLELLQYLEREADLITSQPALGTGDSSKYQTQTATGMSLLNSNMNRAMGTVLRSVSAMIQQCIDHVYRWLMTDSDDYRIKLDCEAYSTGYDRYVASEIHNQQLLQFVQLIGAMPVLERHIDVRHLLPSVLRAYRLDPELLLKPEDQVAQEQQEAMESQLKLQLAEAEIINERKRLELQHEVAQGESDARFREMLSIGKDRRRLQMQERLERLKNGDMLGDPGDLSQHSYLLKDQVSRAEEQQVIDQEYDTALQRQRVGELEAALAPEGGAGPTAQPAPRPVDQQRMAMGGGANAAQMRRIPQTGDERSGDPRVATNPQLQPRQTAGPAGIPAKPL